MTIHSDIQYRSRYQLWNRVMDNFKARSILQIQRKLDFNFSLSFCSSFFFSGLEFKESKCIAIVDGSRRKRAAGRKKNRVGQYGGAWQADIRQQRNHLLPIEPTLLSIQWDTASRVRICMCTSICNIHIRICVHHYVNLTIFFSATCSSCTHLRGLIPLIG